MATTHAVGSGKVFAGLGLPNAEVALGEAKVTVWIYRILTDRKPTPTRAVRLLGAMQAPVSALLRCRKASVSADRLMAFLTILGQDVGVTVKPAKRHGAGPMSATV